MSTTGKYQRQKKQNSRRRGRWIPLTSVASFTVAAAAVGSTMTPIFTSSFMLPTASTVTTHHHQHHQNLPLHFTCTKDSTSDPNDISLFPSRHFIPPGLSMAVTDPETLLEDIIAVKNNNSRKKNGNKKPRKKKPTILTRPEHVYGLSTATSTSSTSAASSAASSSVNNVSRTIRSPVKVAKSPHLTWTPPRKNAEAKHHKVQQRKRSVSSSSSTRSKATTRGKRKQYIRVERNYDTVKETTATTTARAYRSKHVNSLRYTSPSGIGEDTKKKGASLPSTTTNHEYKSSTTTKSQYAPIKKQSQFTATPRKGSRSSTMPGFLDRQHSGRHRAFRDGLQIVENSNSPQAANEIRKKLNSKTAVKKRQKANSEAMYASSASVPDSLAAFAQEIHKESRITPKEEVELGTKTQESIRIKEIYDKLETNLHREPTDAEWCAAAGKINMTALSKALEDGLEAKNHLVTANLRMVQGVVNLYLRNGLGSQYNAGDLMQEGTVALIRAAEKFEPERGFRFSTYAMYWIRSAVKRSQILQSRVINVPQRLHETHKKVLKTRKELKKETGRNPTKEELALAVGITKVQLERCLTAIAQHCFSLDAEIENTLKPNTSDNNKDTLYDLLDSKHDDAESREMRSFFMKEDLVDSLKRHLSAHEVDLLLLRYGLMDEKTQPHGFSGPLTISEVSNLVGMKPDKVRRTINKSLRQLRHLIAHEWHDFEKELY